LLTSVGIGAEAVWAAIKKRSKRLLVRQRDDGMKRSAADEVECQRQSGVVRPRTELLLAGGSPSGKKSSHDDSDIEKIGVRRPGLERKRTTAAVPGIPRQESRGAQRRRPDTPLRR